ncbi:hypothetical protein [Ancylobacter amanitiformis]|uniref:Uncharacterized protein n=1 Tax=Ancylobacter amanitiformis TaxID=217069 RepID=A0ABU0LQF1_9HYPH|nr:hypothetical protein [Ancylobacter amanitiformis]MDQ0510937.1 hypothetical protein [Ancylobacter amanitiformis]
MTVEHLRERLNVVISEWVQEFGEGPSLGVPVEMLLSATTHTLADLLLDIADAALRTELARSTHVYLDLCLAEEPRPRAFGATAKIIPLRPQ